MARTSVVARVLAAVLSVGACSDPENPGTPVAEDASSGDAPSSPRGDAGVLADSSITDASASTPASLRDLGDAPDAGSRSIRPWGMSRDGRFIVGSSDDGRIARAFRWSESSGIQFLLTTERTSGGSRANGVSDNGEMIAGQLIGLATETQAFRWSAGTVTALGWLPGGAGRGPSYGEAMTPDGKFIVGGSTSSSTSESGSEAFSWSDGSGMSPRGDLSGGFFFSGARALSADGTVIGGWGNDATGGRAIRWVNGVPLALPNLGAAPNANVNAVSGDGKVLAGFSQSGAQSWETKPVRWVGDGAAQELGALPNMPWGVALAANADGSVIVGICYGDANNRAGFVWTAGTGVRSLKDRLEAAGVATAGWTLSEPRAVSADGRVVVGFENGNGTLPHERAFRAPSTALRLP